MSIDNDRIFSILYFIYNFHLLFLILAGSLRFIFFFLSTKAKNLEYIHSRFQLYIFLIITNAYNLTIEQKITSSDQ